MLSQNQRFPAVQGPFLHLFLSALSTIAWRNWDIPQTCSRRVATGPYTNLAAALHRDSTVTRTKIRRVYAEGGRLHVPEGLYAPVFFFGFWQSKTVILRKCLKSDTVSDFFHMLSISVSDLYRFMFHNALALFPVGSQSRFSSGSRPHTVKIMSCRSSFQWSVKDIKGHLKQ